MSELARALAALGGTDACAALERLARTNDSVALHFGSLGLDAKHSLLRFLDSKPSRESLCSLLDGLGDAGRWNHARTPDEELLTAVVRLLAVEDTDVQLMAMYVVGGTEIDDATAVRLATAFIACAAVVPPFWRRLHLVAERLASRWAERLEHPAELVALRCIEALGWTGPYGEDHLAELRGLAERFGPSSARGRTAAIAVERIAEIDSFYR